MAETGGPGPIDQPLSTLTLTGVNNGTPFRASFSQRSDGRKGGGLCAEVLPIGYYMGAVPSSIQSLTTFTPRDGVTMRRVAHQPSQEGEP